MKYLRLLHIIVFCLSLPMQGFTHDFITKMPCPMEKAKTPMAHMDCCKDKNDSAKSEKMCKSGCGCFAGCISLGLITPFQATSFLPINGLKFFPSTSLIYKVNLSSVWRPPAFS